ncbi:MAG: hydroxyacid dehydrogenase, partial [Flavobacteriales bacterium]|nr:hydroxyacid dehydrogenase [Flavobacteriales bacterium]
FDVLEYEPKSFEGDWVKDAPLVLQELMKEPNALFTPHVAGWTDASLIKLATVLGDKIIQAFGKQ